MSPTTALDPTEANTAVIGRHLEWMRGQDLAPRTIRRRRTVLQHLAAALDVPLLAAKQPMIMQWWKSLRFSPTGVKHYAGNAREFYAWAAEQGLITNNPLQQLPGLDRADSAAISAHLEWLALRGLSRHTITCRGSTLRLVAATLPTSLLKADTTALMTWRAGLHLAPATISRYVGDIRQFYAWAHKTGLIPANPATEIPAPKCPYRLPRPIVEDELMIALDNAPPRIRPWLVLAGWAGLRAQEIAWLSREAIYERQHPPVLIVTTAAAKGGRERIVPLSDFVISELITAGLPSRGWVFLRSDGIPGPNSPWLISHLANRYLHEIGITATLHQLRHRFATQLYRQTHDLRLVQDLLGHADISQTAGYAAWDRGDGPAAVNTLPAPRH